MRIAAYIRVSSDTQDTTRQEQAITEWCDRKGQVIAEWYRDDEGRNPRDLPYKRRMFQRLLKDVEADQWDSIVVDAADRFGARDTYQFGHFINTLRDHGCQLLDATGKCLSSDDVATIVENMVGSMRSRDEQVARASRNVEGKSVKAKAGEYQGGRPAYGLDVACINGSEKWRIVWDGHQRRRKVYADGREERFDGKGNTPRAELSDSLRYRPSNERRRLEVVNQIFEWFVNESISSGKIATRLNRSNVDPVFGKAWNKQKVSALLANPIYIGRPAWNKRGGGRFKERVDGQLRDVPRDSRNNVKGGRVRDKSDWIMPESPEFDPIVPVEIWDQAQSILGAGSTRAKGIPKRIPNTAELWLGGLVVCGNCNRPMHCMRGGKTRVKPSYFCATYNEHGKDNPTGCRCHKVRHEVLEEYVHAYLSEVAPQVIELLDAMDRGDWETFTSRTAREGMEGITGAMNDPLVSLMQAYQGIACDMIAFIEDCGGLTEAFENCSDLPEVYGMLYEKLEPELRRTLEDKEAEIDRMMDDFRDLGPSLKERANKRMEAVEAEIRAIKSGLGDLRVPHERVYEELETRRVAIEAAQKEITTDTNCRRKHKEVSRVLDRIVCRFRYTDKHGNPTSKKSFLDEVEIHPVPGGSEKVIKNAEQGPG